MKRLLRFQRAKDDIQIFQTVADYGASWKAGKRAPKVKKPAQHIKTCHGGLVDPICAACRELQT